MIESCLEKEKPKLTKVEKSILKIGIMRLYEEGIISDFTTEWLIQALGLSDS